MILSDYREWRLNLKTGDLAWYVNPYKVSDKIELCTIEGKHESQSCEKYGIVYSVNVHGQYRTYYPGTFYRTYGDATNSLKFFYMKCYFTNKSHRHSFKHLSQQLSQLKENYERVVAICDREVKSKRREWVYNYNYYPPFRVDKRVFEFSKWVRDNKKGNNNEKV